MISRLESFDNLKAHPYYGKDYARLSRLELELCRGFCKEREDLSRDQFASESVRWFIGRPEQRPKNINVMVDMLLASNRR